MPQICCPSTPGPKSQKKHQVACREFTELKFSGKFWWLIPLTSITSPIFGGRNKKYVSCHHPYKPNVSMACFGRKFGGPPLQGFRETTPEKLATFKSGKDDSFQLLRNHFLSKVRQVVEKTSVLRASIFKSCKPGQIVSGFHGSQISLKKKTRFCEKGYF